MYSYNPNNFNNSSSRLSKISNITYSKGYDEKISNEEMMSLTQSYDFFFKSIRPSESVIKKSCQNKDFVNDYIAKNSCTGFIGFTGGYTGYRECNFDYGCSEEESFYEKQVCVYNSIMTTERTLKVIIIIVLNFVSRKIINENIRLITNLTKEEEVEYISLMEQMKNQIDLYLELDDLTTFISENFFEEGYEKEIVEEIYIPSDHNPSNLIPSIRQHLKIQNWVTGKTLSEIKAEKIAKLQKELSELTEQSKQYLNLSITDKTKWAVKREEIVTKMDYLRLEISNETSNLKDLVDKENTKSSQKSPRMRREEEARKKDFE